MAYQKQNWQTGQTITANKLNNIQTGVSDMNSEYIKHTWQTGQTITADKLNNIENGIELSSGGNETVYTNLANLVKFMYYKDDAESYINGNNLVLAIPNVGSVANEYPDLFVNIPKDKYSLYAGMDARPRYVYIPNTIKTIGEQAFYGDSSIALLEFEENSQLETIGKAAFSYCFATYKENPNDGSSYGPPIILPEGLKTIGENAFSTCQYVSYFYLPKTVTEIGQNAFGTVGYHYPTTVIDCGFSADSAVASGAPWGAVDTVTINYGVLKPNPPKN